MVKAKSSSIFATTRLKSDVILNPPLKRDGKEYFCPPVRWFKIGLTGLESGTLNGLKKCFLFAKTSVFLYQLVFNNSSLCFYIVLIISKISKCLPLC